MDDKAHGLDLPNNQNPEPYAPAYHGKIPVPHPTNKAAKVVLSGKVMRQVQEAK